ncbi:MAG: hypothetical protein ACYTE5_06500 [Planctomycetota bacterium]|jgi:hypothetical protein
MWNIFEQPWTLLTAGVIALLILLILRGKLAEKRIWWLWLLPIVLVAAAFALDFFVQTDLEKINAAITAVVKAVEDENPDAIEPIIADNYHDSLHGTKKDLLFFCRRKFSEPLVEKNIKRIVSIDISGPKAIAVKNRLDRHIRPKGNCSLHRTRSIRPAKLHISGVQTINPDKGQSRAAKTAR